MDSRELTYDNKMVKRKDRRGFIYALNPNSVLLSAKNAEEKVTYRCPFCHAAMHLLRPHNGEPVFALNPNEDHSEPVCQRIVEHGIYHDLSLSTPEELIMSICYTPKELKKRKKMDGGDTVETVEIDSDPNTDYDPEAVPVRREKFTSLNQIYEYCLDKMGIEKLENGRTLPEYILYFKNHENFFDPDGTLTDLSMRILEVKTTTRAWFGDRRGAIYCKVFWNDQPQFESLDQPQVETKPDYKEIVIAVDLTTKTAVKAVKDRYFTTLEYQENGKTQRIYLPKYKYLLLASTRWLCNDKNRGTCKERYHCGNGNPSETYCAKCFGEYRMTYNNPKQILGIEEIEYNEDTIEKIKESKRNNSIQTQN